MHEQVETGQTARTEAARIEVARIEVAGTEVAPAEMWRTEAEGRGAAGYARAPEPFSRRSPVTDALCRFVQDEIVLGDDEIAPDTDLLLSGAVDSLGVIRITQWIEDEVGIVVEPGDVTLDNFQTIERMSAYITSRAPAGPDPTD